MSAGPDLSIVIPVYNGALTITPLVEALWRARPAPTYEIVLVDDGSADASVAVCRALLDRAPAPLILVELARNFGEHNAVVAGLSQARGAFIVTMDDDLQHPPEAVAVLLGAARAQGLDVVHALHERLRQAVWRRLGSALANACADWVLDKPPGLYLSTFRCLSAEVARGIVVGAGPRPHVDAALTRLTRRVGAVDVPHAPRAAGRSNYTPLKLLRLWLTLAVGQSTKPLWAGAILAAIFSALGAPGLGLAAAILVGAAYLERLVVEARGGPAFVIRAVHRGGPAD